MLLSRPAVQREVGLMPLTQRLQLQRCRCEALRLKARQLERRRRWWPHVPPGLTAALHERCDESSVGAGVVQVANPVAPPGELGPKASTRG